MDANGLNINELAKTYEGVFKTGLEVQDSQVEESQLFDLNSEVSSLNYVGGLKTDMSGLYKPSSLNGKSLMPTSLHPHGILEKADETYVDEDGNKCKVYKNDDGSYQVEKSNGFFGRLFGKTEIEQYDADGNLVAKQKDGVTYYYDENGNLTKTSQGNMASGTVVLYNEDGSISAESKTQMHPNGQGTTTTVNKYNEDGSYTQTVQTYTYSLHGSETTTTQQTFDKNGNPTSPAEEVDSANYLIDDTDVQPMSEEDKKAILEKLQIYSNEVDPNKLKNILILDTLKKYMHSSSKLEALVKNTENTIDSSLDEE